MTISVTGLVFLSFMLGWFLGSLFVKIMSWLFRSTSPLREPDDWP